MAFHGYTAQDIWYGRAEADRDTCRITADATAAELARVSRNAFKGYIGVGDKETREMMQQVRELALAQKAIALELNLEEDLRDYDAVAAKTNQQLLILTGEYRNMEKFPELTDEQKATYDGLLGANIR